MKILIYGLHFKPDLIGIGKYTGEMTDWLDKKGHEIRVITAPPYYPEWKHKDRSFWYRKEVSNYITWRCPIYVPSQPKGLTRLLHLISFAVMSIPILLRNITWKPDCVISIEPPFIISPLTLLYSKINMATSILHIQDLEIDAAFSLNLLKKGSLYKFIKKVEKLILKKFDIITTISPMMEKEIIKKGISRDKINLLPNWADTENIFPGQKYDHLKKQFSITPGQKIILYSGNIGEKQNLSNVVKVAEKMKSNANRIFFIIGDGAVKIRLVQEVESRNISNVIFSPLLPEKDLGALLSLADIHLVTQDKNISDYVLPSKLTNIMSAGGVAIVSAKPETQLARLIKTHDLAYLIPPESRNELYDAINYLLTHQTKLKTIGDNARKYAVDHLSKEIILNNFDQNVLNK